MRDSDVISVYRLQTPVWEFKYGDLLGKVVSSLHETSCHHHFFLHHYIVVTVEMHLLMLLQILLIY